MPKTILLTGAPPRRPRLALVGDDTRSAFRLTLWLGPCPSPPPPDTAAFLAHSAPRSLSLLARDAAALRPGDVILAHNVAVATFRGRVYAQSVAAGVGTRIRLLYREEEDDDDDDDDDEEEEGGRGEAQQRGRCRVGHYSWQDMVVAGPVHAQLGKTRRVRRWLEISSAASPRMALKTTQMTSSQTIH
ncbi:unnamed protein product [Parascedosporium putredinis]|uniref:Uncharacterized protein n=1 Tax=Parascedosporium putredinis TaxID=1442378 RepID=A0A9P1HDC4_9PEZI|nr:unnamed protein product [Parascedosporium putredinis]CAI8004702.1 unnamed protein product [Parascedosporium putredinis]